MSTTATHLKLFVAALAATFFATTAPAHASYGWPLKPFHQQHPVRGFFGDPRIAGNDEGHGTFHFGIDISAPNGTAVYATLDGYTGRNNLHPDVVEISNGRGTVFSYWHVIPSVPFGTRVYAYRTVIGHIEKPWGHVHFSEAENGVYVNPLRPGALGPYADHTKPTVHGIYFERDGKATGSKVAGKLDIVAEAWDTTPLAVPAPWDDKPVTPALVEWRLIGNSSFISSVWHVAADFRDTLPTVSFTSEYALFTRQNHPWHRGGAGRYRFYLAHAIDTRRIPNGIYRVEVRCTDTRNNTAYATRELTIANDV